MISELHVSRLADFSHVLDIHMSANSQSGHRGSPIECSLTVSSDPVNMPLVASTGPVRVRCWQRRPSTDPVLAHNGMFMGDLDISKWVLDSSTLREVPFETVQ